MRSKIIALSSVLFLFCLCSFAQLTARHLSGKLTINTIGHYKLATLFGQPTGEPANDYGELISIILPNTGFSFSTSTKQFISANGNVRDMLPVLRKYKITNTPSNP